MLPFIGRVAGACVLSRYINPIELAKTNNCRKNCWRKEELRIAKNTIAAKEAELAAFYGRKPGYLTKWRIYSGRKLQTDACSLLTF